MANRRDLGVRAQPALECVVVPEPGIAPEVRGQPVVQPQPLLQGQREETGRRCPWATGALSQ